MQVRKASLLLIICTLITSITSLICSVIYSRTPFSFSGFETPTNNYLSSKYSSTKYQLQWVVFIQESIAILLLILIATYLALRINTKPLPIKVSILVILFQTILSQISVAGHSIGILLQIGYFGGNQYVDFAITALRCLGLVLIVIVLITNLYNFVSQPQQCIEMISTKSKAQFQPDPGSNKKEDIVKIEQQEIQTFHKNRPPITPSYSPMSAFFDGLGQKNVEVQLDKPQAIRMTHQDQSKDIQNNVPVQPIPQKKYQRTIKIPKLDLKNVRNSVICPQIFFPSFAELDISAIHHQSKPKIIQYDLNSSQSDSEALQIEQALSNKNNCLSQPLI